MSTYGIRRKKARGPAGRRAVARKRRHARILKKVRGTGERPRLVVRRSLRHLEAQLVDDDRGVCLTGISTRAKEVQAKLQQEERQTKTAQSKIAGEVLAARVKALGIERIVFDRGGYPYHGRVQAFAEGAREGGLKI